MGIALDIAMIAALNNPTYLVAFSIALAAIIAGAFFRDRRKVLEGAILVLVLSLLLATIEYSQQQAAEPSAVQVIPEQDKGRVDDNKGETINNQVVPKPPEKIVDGVPGHRESPQVKANPILQHSDEKEKRAGGNSNAAGQNRGLLPASDMATVPPPTFDPKSPVKAPRPPYDLPENPNRQMPVTLRPVPTPDDFVPNGQPQTVQPMTLYWVQRPDGTWQLQPYWPPKQAK